MDSSSEPLSIESFSDSWLTSTKSPLDICLEEDSIFRPSLDFNFDVPNSQFHEQPPLVHADQLFSDGIIKPSTVYLASNVSSTVSFRVVVVPKSCVVDVQCQILRRWRKSVEQIVQKWCGFLRTLCYKIIGSRTSRRSRRQISSSNSSSTPQSSPVNNDFEHSIYEAILHCKRSIG